MEDKVTHIQVSFNKEELFKLYMMMSDSVAYWRSQLENAEQDPKYYLSPKGCQTVLSQCQEMYNKHRDLYHKHFD
jgi:hypothetical protein